MSFLRVCCCAMAAAVVLSGCVHQPAPEKKLEVVLHNHEQVWNAVAHFDGNSYVAGPRWTGSNGPQLSIIDAQGRRAAFPDRAWNDWVPGRDARQAFVNINALRLEGNVLWVVDTGAPEFGGDPIPGGAKLVAINLVEKRVVRTYPFNAQVALPGSYIDDVRFQGGHAFLTDAGKPGLIVVDMASGSARRVLDGHASVTAGGLRNIVLSGQTLNAPDGRPLRVNADPLEVSADGQWLYYGPLQGPWSKARISDLTDAQLTAHQQASRVQPFADLPPTGGTVMDEKGNLYFSDLAHDAIRVRRPDGRIDTLIEDPRLHWVDAPFLDKEGVLWLPAAQMDRVSLFNGGNSRVQWPMTVYRLPTR